MHSVIYYLLKIEKQSYTNQMGVKKKETINSKIFQIMSE